MSLHQPRPLGTLRVRQRGHLPRMGKLLRGAKTMWLSPTAKSLRALEILREDIVYESFGKGTAQDAIPEANMGPDLDVFQNPKTKSLHARAKGSTGKLICGRSLDNMKTFEGKVFSHRWMCKQCIAGRPVRDIGALNSFLAKKQGRPA